MVLATALNLIRSQMLFRTPLLYRAKLSRFFHTTTRCHADLDTNILASGNATTTSRISRYGKRGFTVSGITSEGSLLVLSTIHLHWKVEKASDITCETLAAVELFHPRPEILVIGTGDRSEPIPDKTRKHLRSLGILVEVQDSRNACATFNFLSEEGRLAAAALIPPANFVKENVKPKKKKMQPSAS